MTDKHTNWMPPTWTLLLAVWMIAHSEPPDLPWYVSIARTTLQLCCILWIVRGFDLLCTYLTPSQKGPSK